MMTKPLNTTCTPTACTIYAESELIYLPELICLPVVFEVPVLEEVEALGLESTGGGRVDLES